MLEARQIVKRYYGVAVVSDVTQNADPDARVRQWLGHSAEAA